MATQYRIIKRGIRIAVNIMVSIVLVASLATSMLFYVAGYMSLSEDSDNKQEMSDVKTSVSEDVTYFLVAGTDEGENLTDIMMVVCYDHGKGEANILQIPRDTFIGTDIPTGKVNAVYGSAKDGDSKINGLIRRINDYFGLPIDQYINVSLNAFRKVVDAVGGVDVNIPQNMTAYDSRDAKYTFSKGVNHLDGGEAEAFVRYRRGYATGDIGRVEAQRNFYAAFVKAVINMSYSEMASAAMSCYDDFKTSMAIGTLLGYAEEAQKLDMSKIKIHAVPGQSGTYSPQGIGRSYYSIHKQEYVDIINQYFLPYSDVKLTTDEILIRELHTEERTSDIDPGGALDEYIE